jgi:hypothetical protein
VRRDDWQVRVHGRVVPERLLRLGRDLRRRRGAVGHELRFRGQRLRRMLAKHAVQWRRLLLRGHELRRVLQLWCLRDQPIERHVRIERHDLPELPIESGMQLARRLRLRCEVLPRRLLRRERQVPDAEQRQQLWYRGCRLRHLRRQSEVQWGQVLVRRNVVPQRLLRRGDVLSLRERVDRRMRQGRRYVRRMPPGPAL